jgi:transcriptional regulator with XRE-family HTH domain
MTNIFKKIFMDTNYLPKNIKYLRKINSKTQAQLGLEVNKGHTSIGNWETGFNEPNNVDLKKIAIYFGVSIDDLLTKDLSKVKEYAINSKDIKAIKTVNEPTISYGKKCSCAECIEKDKENIRLKAQLDLMKELFMQQEMGKKKSQSA